MSGHKHPINSKPTKVEKVDFVKYGSEGCEEHYNDRVVTSSAYDYEKLTTNGVNPYLKAMVIGEALAVPLCKKR